MITIERLPHDDTYTGHCSEVGCHNPAQYMVGGPGRYLCVIHIPDPMFGNTELINCTPADIVSDVQKLIGDDAFDAGLAEEFKCTYFISIDGSVDTRHCGAAPNSFEDGFVTCEMGHRVKLERR